MTKENCSTFLFVFLFTGCLFRFYQTAKALSHPSAWIHSIKQDKKNGEITRIQLLACG